MLQVHIITCLLGEGKQSYAVHWEPPPEDTYKWRHKRPNMSNSLRIYECHIGISGSESKISSFDEFTSKVNLFNIFMLVRGIYIVFLDLCFPRSFYM